MDADERLIRAIQQINDPEADPARIESDAESDNSECHPVAPERVDADMQRLMDDMALRNHHGIGGAFTGPKGVIADRKFHRQQELARAALKLERDNAQMSQKAMSKGWLNRQPDSSKTFYQQEEEDDNFLAEYRMKRISQLASNTSNSQVHELDFNSYVSFIDDAHPSTRVIIHLYQAQIEPCRIINTLMTSLASEYPDVKFGKIISTEADPDFDAIALPAVLVYQQGGN